jgi:hypothetical protein
MPARIVRGAGDDIFALESAAYLDRTLPGSRGVRYLEGAKTVLARGISGCHPGGGARVVERFLTVVRRRPGPILILLLLRTARAKWIPAFAGMTEYQATARVDAVAPLAASSRRAMIPHATSVHTIIAPLGRSKIAESTSPLT